jgi:hypothetical protein
MTVDDHNTPPKCRYWQDANITYGGRCAISLFKNPSYGACRFCIKQGKISRGFGDTIAKCIHIASFGLFRKTRDCDCYRRQKALNMLLPYKSKMLKDARKSNGPILSEIMDSNVSQNPVLAPNKRRRKCSGCGKKKEAA